MPQSELEEFRKTHYQPLVKQFAEANAELERLRRLVAAHGKFVFEVETQLIPELGRYSALSGTRNHLLHRISTLKALGKEK